MNGSSVLQGVMVALVLSAVLFLTGCPRVGVEGPGDLKKAMSGAGCRGCEPVEGEEEQEGEMGEGEIPVEEGETEGEPPEGEVEGEAAEGESMEGEAEGEPVEGELEGESVEVETQTLWLPGEVPLILVKIPAGTFQMGSPDTERNREAGEGPVHGVTIGSEFYLGKYEITQAQWLALMESWPTTAPPASLGAGDDYPAYYVSWEDARDFVDALNAHIVATGQGPANVRLPSEAEWEYACRAGTQTRFFFGDSLAVDDGCEDDGVRGTYMWFCPNSETPAGTRPVGTKLPNAFGLHDMSGNVYEWCEDDWHDTYAGAPTDGSPWVDEPRNANRSYRGGRWYNDARYCRSATRFPIGAGYRGEIGFRIAR